MWQLKVQVVPDGTVYFLNGFEGTQLLRRISTALGTAIVALAIVALCYHFLNMSKNKDQGSGYQSRPWTLRFINGKTGPPLCDQLL